VSFPVGYGAEPWPEMHFEGHRTFLHLYTDALSYMDHVTFGLDKALQGVGEVGVRGIAPCLNVKLHL